MQLLCPMGECISTPHSSPSLLQGLTTCLGKLKSILQSDCGILSCDHDVITRCEDSDGVYNQGCMYEQHNLVLKNATKRIELTSPV